LQLQHKIDIYEVAERKHLLIGCYGLSVTIQCQVSNQKHCWG